MNSEGMIVNDAIHVIGGIIIFGTVSKQGSGLYNALVQRAVTVGIAIGEDDLAALKPLHGAMDGRPENSALSSQRACSHRASMRSAYLTSTLSVLYLGRGKGIALGLGLFPLPSRPLR